MMRIAGRIWGQADPVKKNAKEVGDLRSWGSAIGMQLVDYEMEHAGCIRCKPLPSLVEDRASTPASA